MSRVEECSELVGKEDEVLRGQRELYDVAHVFFILRIVEYMMEEDKFVEGRRR